MKFKYLRKLVIEQIEQDHKESLKELETEEGLNKSLSRNGKSYIKNPKQKLIKLLENRIEKKLKEIIDKIEGIENAEDFKNDLIITLEWKKSYMWGSNPRAYTNYGFAGESIGGYGYCKTSTATAQALNSDLRILKLLYKKKEKEIKKYLSKGSPKIDSPHDNTKFKPNLKGDFNRHFLGYGCGYNILPKFEGGVGVSSHERIIEGLGLNWKNVTSTDQTDVYMISK